MTDDLTTTPHLPTIAAIYIAAEHEVGAYEAFEDDMAAILARMDVDPQAMYDALVAARAERVVEVPAAMLAGILDIVDDIVLDDAGADNDLAVAVARDVVELNDLLPSDHRRPRRERYADLLAPADTVADGRGGFVAGDHGPVTS